MPTTLTREWPQTALARILEALEGDLLQASDTEILQVAKELGIDPAMKDCFASYGFNSLGDGHREELDPLPPAHRPVHRSHK